MMKNNQHLTTVKKYYANAKTVKDALDNALLIIENHWGLLPKDIIYADSLCSDELNSMQFPQNKMLGPFKLGGLGGYPFAGLTGMAAFSQHIPEGGAALLIYGPHIGITQEGKVGKTQRIGQSNPSGCCGSVSAALNNLLMNQMQKVEITDSNYQQNVIERIILKEKERIKKSDNQIMEAMEVIYEAIDQQIDSLISKTDFPCKYLIQMGGIFINGEPAMGSFWAAKRFEFLNIETKEIYKPSGF